MSFRILPADPDWPRQFKTVKSALVAVVPQDAVIHHIGSTSVANLVAKNVIDIQITVGSLDDLNKKEMEGVGFVHRAVERDHCPPGMTLPMAELAKQYFKTSDPISANIHVRERGRFNQRYPLLCRDYLRAHPLAAAAYGEIKLGLAAHFSQDADAYYQIKDPVFDLIMVAAEDWARATRWQIPAGD
ncbi:GrpB family protein [Labrenzia sp. CE80]|uniref:GrpB family protein n=1 Tax=Labrenzia sp. CE80 TaxID=1788986 RepID=UPI00129BA9BD|nr:GrpB family protein [Labrenzia sp. CE80]